MKQLIDISATVSSLTCRAEKSGKEWSDDKAATLTVVANCDGKAASQFFPSGAHWQGLADAVFDDGGAIKLRLGTFPLEYEIQGGTVELRCPLWEKPLKFEGADVKSISVTPCEGRVCEIKFALNLHPQDEEWEQLVRMLKREIVVSASRSLGNAEQAEQAGQTSMPLQQAGEGDEESDRQEQLDAAAGLSPEAAKIVEQLRKDEAEEKAAAEQAKPLVPGQKPPQRAKKTTSSAASLN